MWNWFKSFILDYAVWTFLDWLVYTRSGRAFLSFVGLAVMSAVGQLWLSPWRHDFEVAFVVLLSAAFVIALSEGAVTIFSGRTTRGPAVSLTTIQEQMLRQTATNWLKSRFADQKLKILHCGLFGSILHDHYPTSDVDIAVLLEPLSEGRFAHVAKAIRGNVAAEFRQQFGHRLQVQFFAASETARFEDFCLRGDYEALI